MCNLEWMNDLACIMGKMEKKNLFLPYPSLILFSVRLVNVHLFQWRNLEVIGGFMWSNRHLVDM